MFKTIYLYIKTHNTTGLRYFGKTIKDPHVYMGSGTRWLNHLKVHGNDVTTEIVGTFANAEECNQFAVDFSEQNSIVESAEWANLKIEDGLDGGFSPNHSEHMKKIWASLSEEDYAYRRKVANPRLKMTPEVLAQYEERHQQSMIEMYKSDAGKKLIEHKREVGKAKLVNGKRVLSEEARQRMRESARRTNESRWGSKSKD